MKTIVRRIKTLGRTALGKEPHVKLDIRCPQERFGSSYGGWQVVTKSLGPESIVYSCGVGEDASFDTALIDKFHLTVHAFDPTPKSIAWVKKQGFSDHFVMHEYGIASFDGLAHFNPPDNPDHVSHTLLDRPETREKAISIAVKTLKTIMKDLRNEHIDILKMDIEGSEYDVIDDLIKSDIYPDQILVEFHHRFPGIEAKKTQNTIDKLRGVGYRLFSISATNEEFCFIRDPA